MTKRTCCFCGVTLERLLKCSVCKDFGRQFSYCSKKCQVLFTKIVKLLNGCEPTAWQQADDWGQHKKIHKEMKEGIFTNAGPIDIDAEQHLELIVKAIESALFGTVTPHIPLTDRLTRVESSFHRSVYSAPTSYYRARLINVLRAVYLPPIVELAPEESQPTARFAAFAPHVCIGIFDTEHEAKSALAPWVGGGGDDGGDGGGGGGANGWPLVSPSGFFSVVGPLLAGASRLSHLEWALIALVHARHAAPCASTGRAPTDPAEYVRQLPTKLPRAPGACLVPMLSAAGEVQIIRLPAS